MSTNYLYAQFTAVQQKVVDFIRQQKRISFMIDDLPDRDWQNKMHFMLAQKTIVKHRPNVSWAFYRMVNALWNRVSGKNKSDDEPSWTDRYIMPTLVDETISAVQKWFKSEYDHPNLVTAIVTRHQLKKRFIHEADVDLLMDIMTDRKLTAKVIFGKEVAIKFPLGSFTTPLAATAADVHILQMKVAYQTLEAHNDSLSQNITMYVNLYWPCPDYHSFGGCSWMNRKEQNIRTHAQNGTRPKDWLLFELKKKKAMEQNLQKNMAIHANLEQILEQIQHNVVLGTAFKALREGIPVCFVLLHSHILQRGRDAEGNE